MTTKDPGHPFPIMGDMVRYQASLVTPPVAVDPLAWIAKLNPSILATLPKPGSYK